MENNEKQYKIITNEEELKRWENANDQWEMKQETQPHKTLTAKKIPIDRYCVDDQFDLFVAQTIDPH